MRFAIYSEREQRRRDDRQTMDGGQVRIPRRRAEYEYRCRSRTALSPAGSVRVGYGLPSAGHSLPSALRCPKFFARCRFAKFRPLHVSRPAFFRYRRRTFVGTLFTSISSCGIRCIGSLPPCGARNFFARCRFAKFRPLHVSRPAFFRRRRRTFVRLSFT